MLLTEYNEAETMERFEKDGERKGDRNRMIRVAQGMVREGIGFDVIARVLQISVDEVKSISGIKPEKA